MVCRVFEIQQLVISDQAIGQSKIIPKQSTAEGGCATRGAQESPDSGKLKPGVPSYFKLAMSITNL
jgi:hypothetical protein